MRVLIGTTVALIVACTGLFGWQNFRALQTAKAALVTLEPGPIDVGFAQAMSVHHLQAIGMAQLLLDGRPTGLPALARQIAYTQLEELGQMRGWLRLWQQPLLPASRTMNWMLLGDTAPDEELTRYLLDCDKSPTGMAGLATDADMNRLRQLEGRARDELFLALMLAHHQGGVPMAGFAAQQARLPAVRELASRIVIDQSEEIYRIQAMQAALLTVSP